MSIRQTADLARQLLVGATLQLAAYRTVAAGLVISILMLTTPGAGPGGFFASLLFAPFAVAVFVGFGIICGLLARLGIPWVGLGSFVALLGAVGDPILWLIEKKRPGTLPVQVFNLFNRPIIWVFRNDEFQ